MMADELTEVKTKPEPVDPQGFTEFQLRFIEAIVLDPELNRARAAKKAGKSTDYARTIGYVTFNIPHVKAEISRRLVEARKDWKINVDQRYVVDRVKRTIDRCLQVVPVLDKEGKPTGEYTFNAAGALRGLDMLARFGGMYEEAGSTPPNGAPGGTPGTTINLQVILPMVRAALDELKKGNAPTGPVVIQQPEAGEPAGEPGPESLADYLKTKGA